MSGLDPGAFSEKLLRNIAGNFVRELYWLHGHVPGIDYVCKYYNEDVFLHWLAARASFGRVSVAHVFSSDRVQARVEGAIEYLVSNFEGLREAITREQEKLRSFSIGAWGRSKPNISSPGWAIFRNQ